MKILLLAPGISIHSQRFLQMLLDAGYAITLVDTHNPIPEGAERYSFILYPDAFGLGRLGLRTLNQVVVPRIMAWQLHRIWQHVRPDIVHVHWVDKRAYASAIAGLHPLVLTCWGSDINNLFSPEWEDVSHKEKIIYAIQVAEHVIADSSEILNRCNNLAGKIVNSSLNYFGVDMEKFKPQSLNELHAYKKSLNIPSHARVILSTRALRPLMGHHRILDAFSQIARHPSFLDTILVFMRYLPFQDSYEAQLKKRIQELQLDDRVIWIDASPNESMPLLYGVSDVVVNFPERDGFPVTFFEVAACRRPFVTCELPAYADVIHGDECWLVPPANVERLAQRIMDCLSASASESLRRLDMAYSNVKSKGEQKICFAQMEAVYGALLRN